MVRRTRNTPKQQRGEYCRDEICGREPAQLLGPHVTTVALLQISAAVRQYVRAKLLCCAV